jgi:hypothetical protein
VTKDARRYKVLALYARGQGYPKCKEHAVQQWTKRDLVPRAVSIFWGQGRRSVTDPVQTGAQLLAVCHLRFDLGIRSLDEIAAYLWVDRFDIPVGRVRAGLASLGDLEAHVRRAAARERSGATGGQRDAAEVAVHAVYDRHIADLVGRPRLDKADLTQGLTDYIRVVAEGRSPTEMDLDGLTALCRLGSLDRASRASGRGTAALGPDGLAQLLGGLRGLPLSSIVAAASDHELLLARDAAPETADAWCRDMNPTDPIQKVLRTSVGQALVILALLAAPRAAIAVESPLARPDILGAPSRRY